MCGSGGGGESGNYEKERQRQINDATHQVNSLFGIGGRPPPEKKPVNYIPKRWSLDDPSIDIGLTQEAFEAQEAARKAKLYADAEQEYQAAVSDWERGASTTERNRQAREETYGQVGDEARQAMMGDLDRQHVDTERQNRFQLGRRGLTGGSAQVDLNRKRDDAYNRGALDVGNRADAAAFDLRDRDERSRMAILNAIQGGMGAAAASQMALSSMGADVNQVKNASALKGLGNMFGGVGLAANDYRDREATARARADFENLGTFFTPKGGFFGRTS